jgi:hypothetical protein
MSILQATILCLFVYVLFGIKWKHRNSKESRYVRNPLYTDKQNDGLAKTHDIMRITINVMQTTAVIVFVIIMIIYTK